MTAMLAGYTRMTYSLAVIAMETTQAINIYLPILITIGVSNFVGSKLTRGLYDRAVRAKQMPILKRKVPEPNRLIRAENIMADKVITLKTVDSLKRVYEALRSPHHGFPVVNYSGQVIGLISKNYLITLVRRKNFYSHPDQKYLIVNGHLKKYLREALAIQHKLEESMMHHSREHSKSEIHQTEIDGSMINQKMLPKVTKSAYGPEYSPNALEMS